MKTGCCKLTLKDARKKIDIPHGYKYINIDSISFLYNELNIKTPQEFFFYPGQDPKPDYVNNNYVKKTVPFYYNFIDSTSTAKTELQKQITIDSAKAMISGIKDYKYSAPFEKEILDTELKKYSDILNQMEKIEIKESRKVVINPGNYKIKDILKRLDIKDFNVELFRFKPHTNYLIRPVGSKSIKSHGDLFNLLYDTDSDNIQPNILGKNKLMYIRLKEVDRDLCLLDGYKSDIIDTIYLNTVTYGDRIVEMRDKTVWYKLKDRTETLTFEFLDADCKCSFKNAVIRMELWLQ